MQMLSQFPVETNLVQTAIPTSRVFLAAMQPDQASAKDGDTTFAYATTTRSTEAPSMEEPQRADPELALIIIIRMVPFQREKLLADLFRLGASL